MSPVKILEVNPEGPGLLFRFLQFLSQERGWNWQLENRSDFSPEVFQEIDALLVSSAISEAVLSQTQVLTSRVRELGVLDSYFKEDGAWYPRILLHEALRMVLVTHARDLDIRAPAFVIGNSAEVRVIASLLTVMGLREIYLAGEPDLLESQRALLNRAHFGIQFNITPLEDLTLQSVSAGIVVNTVDLSQQESVLTDLSYFNYMKKAGYVLDLNLHTSASPLIEEALKAELRGLGPELVLEALSQLWLEKMRPDHGMTAVEIHESWTRFLK